LLPLFSQLREQYPNISLELSLSDKYIDLIEEQVDIAIRIGHLPDSSLVAKKIGVKRWGWYASPEYLHIHGTPTHPNELNNHQCLVFKNSNIELKNWPFDNGNGRIESIQIQSNMTTDDSRALVEMARLGLGIIMIDPLLIRKDIEQTTLIPILTDWKHPSTDPINLVCLGRNYRSRASTSIWEALYQTLKFD
jgi:DNA-binding transcriptional LysR family regulator